MNLHGVAIFNSRHLILLSLSKMLTRAASHSEVQKASIVNVRQRLCHGDTAGAEIRRQGDRGTGRQGDKEKRRRGGNMSLSLPLCPPVSLSPCLLVPLSLCRCLCVSAPAAAMWLIRRP